MVWLDLAKAHYSNIVQQCLTEKNLPFVSRVDNPSNVPQARPIETVLERKIYENYWQAKKMIIWLKESNKKQKNLIKKCCKASERMLARSSELCAEMNYIQFFSPSPSRLSKSEHFVGSNAKVEQDMKTISSDSASKTDSRKVFELILDPKLYWWWHIESRQMHNVEVNSLNESSLWT